VGWAERLAIAVGLVSLAGFTLYTVLYPNIYLALSSMLVCVMSVVAIAELRVMREMEKLEHRLTREIRGLKEMLERVRKDA
jgi:hypothetical protein